MPKRASSSDSDRGSYRRKRTSRRRSSSSSGMSSDLSTDAKHSHRVSRRSRSRSKDRTRRQRSRSRSSSRSPKRKYRHSRSRSSSRGRRSRRSSRSRSSSRGRSYSSKQKKSHHHHKSKQSSKSQSGASKSTQPHSSSSQSEGKTDEGTLKNKIQQALKAAASANAELREKGLLPSGATTELLATSIADQIKRAQVIEEINAPSFSQQTFLSSRNATKPSTEKGSEDIGLDAHSAAIFGFAAPKLGVSTSSDASIKKLESWKENPEKLVHENLFVDQAGKEERWKKKLMALRRKNINGEAYM